MGVVNIVGNRYGKLKVVELHHTNELGSFWKCECDCGNTIVVRKTRLNSYTYKKGLTSCGCDREVTLAEKLFEKRWKDLNEQELKQYQKFRYQNSARYQKQLEWIEIQKSIELRRKERELATKLEPLERIKDKIMELDIETTRLQQIESIINCEIEKIKGEDPNA